MPDPEVYSKVTNAIQGGKFDVAKKALDPLLKNEPENIGLLLDAGFIYANLDLYKEAEGHYTKVMELAPNSPAGYTGLGFVYKIQEDHEKRFEMFSKALEISPSNAMIHFEIGETYLDMDRFEDALKEFKNAIKFGEPEIQGEAMQRMAQTYMGLDKPEKTIEIGKKILTKYPDLYTIHYVMAGADALLENWKKAEEHLGKYLEMEPDDLDAKDMLAHIKEEQN